MAGELTERHIADRAALRQFGDIARDRIVEAQLAALHRLGEHDGLEHLAHGGDVEQRVRSDGAAARHVGEAVIVEQRAAADADGNRHAANGILAEQLGHQLLRDQPLDVAVVCGADSGRGGTGDQRGDQHCRGKPHGVLVPRRVESPVHQSRRQQNVPGG